jgi:hypothetical protein
LAHLQFSGAEVNIRLANCQRRPALLAVISGINMGDLRHVAGINMTNIMQLALSRRAVSPLQSAGDKNESSR